MNKYLYLAGITFIICWFIGCSDQNPKQLPIQNQDSVINVVNEDEQIAKPALSSEQKEQIKFQEQFVPEGFIIFDTITGDLNNDGLDDCVLIIKGTDKSKIVKWDNRDELADRNRRGIIVLFRKNDHYELAVKNYDCFSSENEEGVNYYAPELDFEIKKGKLYINYAHGRYGYWGYTFRFQNSDFELIGYDDSNNHGPIVNSQTSINYLTGKKNVSKNVNENTENSGDEIFEETVTKINIDKLIKLSEIKDFDEFDISR